MLGITKPGRPSTSEFQYKRETLDSLEVMASRPSVLDRISRRGESPGVAIGGARTQGALPYDLALIEDYPALLNSGCTVNGRNLYGELIDSGPGAAPRVRREYTPLCSLY